jgi:hypothetical protein
MNVQKSTSAKRIWTLDLLTAGLAVFGTAASCVADPSQPTQVVMSPQQHVSSPISAQRVYVSSIQPTQQKFEPYTPSYGYNNPNAPYNYVAPSQWPVANIARGGESEPLQGYAFGSYYDNFNSCYGEALPSAYGLYFGVPSYTYVDLGAAVAIEPVYSDSSGTDSTFEPSTPPVNQTNYYVTNNYYGNGSPSGATASSQKATPSSPTSAPDYVGAITAIQDAWQTGSTDIFRNFLPSSADKIAVSINGKYSYSIDADHFAEITQNAFDALRTYSFRVSDIRLETDGTVTAFATHVYAPSNSDSTERDKMYLSFTLSEKNDLWVVIAIDSSTSPLLSDPVITPVPPK